MSSRRTILTIPAGIICLLASAGLLPADPVDGRLPKSVGAGDAERRLPAWQVAINRTKEKGHYVARCVRTEMRVYDGDENLLGSVSEVERMEPDGGKPRWKSESKNQTGNPGMTIRVDFGLQANPASALEGYDEWRLRGKGQLEGAAIEEWEGITQANPQNTVVVAIDVASGFPRKAEFTFPFSTPLGSQLVHMSLVYEPNPDGVWLPARSVCEQKARFFLYKRHIHLTKTYTDWAERP